MRDAESTPSLRGTAPQVILDPMDETQSRRQLDRLIHDQIEPVIAGILRRFWGCGGAAAQQRVEEQDAEDVRQEVIVQLLPHLHASSTRPGGESIRDLRSYVAATTYHLCERQLRQKHPLRWRVKSQLRYLLTHEPRFALWHAEGGPWLCGLAAWRGREPAREAVDGLQPHPEAFSVALGASSGGEAGGSLVYQVESVLTAAGGPVDLEDLVSCIAKLRGIHDPTVRTGVPQSPEVDTFERVADLRVDVAAAVDQRAYLQQLWDEICRLPLRQRSALLLNLRDEQGRGAISLFPLTGVATLGQIAAALEMPAERFAVLWNDLPLDDRRIGEILGLTRQQVINLRKSGRERLARRMQQFEQDD